MPSTAFEVHLFFQISICVITVSEDAFQKCIWDRGRAMLLSSDGQWKMQKTAFSFAILRLKQFYTYKQHALGIMMQYSGLGN